MTLPEKMYTMNHRNSDALQERFPPEVTSKKPVFTGGRKTDEVDFVAWHHYSRKLNELFPLTWGVSVSRVDTVADYILMVVDVKIGSYSYCGTGQAKADKDNWGGAHAEAFSQAFRRACAQAGLGLYFYGMEEMAAVEAKGIKDELDEDAREAIVEDMEEAGLMGDPPDEPTTQQLDRLSELAASGVFSGAALDEYREEVRSHYTRNGVGLTLRRMKNEYRATTGEEFSPS
jgi:hypothetical protein